MFDFISNAKGFGINYDIYETNILNLSVVIAVLIYYGRIVLVDLVNNHKSIVLKNLEEAEARIKEAEKNLSSAQKNFDMANLKSIEIAKQGSLLSSQTAKTLLENIEKDIQRLQLTSLSIVNFEQEKSITEVCQKLTDFSFKLAVEILNKRLNSNVQKKIFSQNIDKLSFKSLIRR